MRIQVISSGSQGNCTLIRAGELSVLVDAGLTLGHLRPRLEEAGIGMRTIDHILVTHAHLDHARSVGALAKKQDATVHCPTSMMRNNSVTRAPRLMTVAVDGRGELPAQSGESLHYVTAGLPHDCDPTVAFALDHEDRRFVVLTDMGFPEQRVSDRLQGAHVLMLEFNYDSEMLASGPYPDSLKRRIRGNGGHLSNEQSQVMLEQLAGPNLHTLILAHLSETNNSPEMAEAAARQTLSKMGRDEVRVIIASQHEPLEPIDVRAEPGTRGDGRPQNDPLLPAHPRTRRGH
jgi:phosphoribosyl 1,2-cyclic phosphodiesterase